MAISVDSQTSGEDGRRILRRNPDPHLFRPITIRSLTVRNRIMLSPMCQYSATDGLMNDWHFSNLAARAVGGAGIVCTEAVHTEPHARITRHCLGLWNDLQRDAMRRIVDFVGTQDAVPAIQFGHAGRKASVGRPWEGTYPITPAQGGWDVISASARPYATGWPVPTVMTRQMIDDSLEAVAGAARRARDAGFKLIEIHGAHGYLIHQFLSPLSNFRDDDYGGSFDNRIRLLQQTIAAIRSEWPAEYPLFLRLSCTDWVDGGWSLDDSIALCRILKETGEVDLIDCSSGGNDPRQQIPTHPGYQVPFAAAIRMQTGMMTGAVGLIHRAEHAEAIIANGDADLVILGRTLLANPSWPLHAARELKASNVKWPVQYERSDIF